MTLYLERLLLCHAHCSQQNKHSIAVCAPTRRHPSRHTLTPLIRFEIWRGRLGVGSISSANQFTKNTENVLTAESGETIVTLPLTEGDPGRTPVVSEAGSRPAAN